MNTPSLKRKFRRSGTWLLFLSACVLAEGSESERIYSLAEVAVIDRENRMLRQVDATESVEANVQRLLAAGFPSGDVEELKPRLVAMWGEIDPPLQIDWLDTKTLARIQELKQEYTIPMRTARLREATYRLGGESAPETPDQVKTRWRSAIWLLLGLDERDDFALMNSAPAIALCALIKNLPMTITERRTLCLLQQDYLGATVQIKIQSYPGDRPQISARRTEAVLDYWQRARDLLGDDRFAAFLHATDAGFERMAGVLNQIGGVGHSKALDLWWVRKNNELADGRMLWGGARYRQKLEAYASATAVLGPEVIGIYEQNEDGKWLNGMRPFRRSKAGIISLKASRIEGN